MPCYRPRTVWRSPKKRNRSGALKTLFKKPHHMFDKVVRKLSPTSDILISNYDFYQPEEFQIPGCSPMCVGCQEAYSRAWAVRCWHESQLHDSNCFVTLTFNDKFCPKNGLDHGIFQKFMKRLRRFLGAVTAKRVRFYMAGEYGSETGRPHFHACLFGFDFSDRQLWSVRGDVRLDTSEILKRLWSVPMRGSLKGYPPGSVRGESFGFSSVGDVTFESAAYIARYCAKKVRGDAAPAHYKGMKPEYTRMSLKPGIGKNWFLAYKDSVFPDDAVSLGNGRRCKVPRSYDKVFELTDPVAFNKLKQLRKDRAKRSPDNTPDRLKVRERVKKAQLKQLKRGL